MKSYDETINSVFDRMEQYHQKQKRNRKMILSAVTPVCMAAICITGIFLFHKEPAAQPDNSTLSSPVSTVSTPIPTTQVDTAIATKPANSDDKIIINALGEIPENRMNIALMINDTVKMTLEELSRYYGTNIVPDVPDCLRRQENETYEIYRSDGGIGEVYWDQNSQHFSNEDNSQSIIVDTRKGSLPFYCFVVYEPEYEKSVINGTEVLIGLDESGWYQVWFMYQNTGFYIGAEGVTEEELVNVIRSLTD